MEPQLLRCGNTNKPRLHNSRCKTFNGATTFALWKLVKDRKITAEDIILQWSHNFCVVETITGSTPIDVTIFTFNGATTFALWKQ